MKNEDYKISIILKSDIYRYGEELSIMSFIKVYRVYKEYRFVFWLRVVKYFGSKKVYFIFKVISKIIYRIFSLMYSIDFPPDVKVGLGLRINHGMGLVVNGKSQIGNNVTLSHNVTFASEKGLYPVVRDRVRISPGVVLVGGVEIGDDVVIGANCVVTKSVPARCVAVGIPNRNINRQYEEDVDRFYFDVPKK